MNSESEKLASKYIMDKYGHKFVFRCETMTLSFRKHRYEILCEQEKEKN